MQQITDEIYSNTSVAPYYASIGNHIRHVLDVFDCIIEGFEQNEINLVQRKRNSLAENFTAQGIDYIEKILEKLKAINSNGFSKSIVVKDDLGLGVISANYTLGAAIMQAHSHAIHHFASIGYILNELGVDLPNDDFGFNPTTQKKNDLSGIQFFYFFYIASVG